MTNIQRKALAIVLAASLPSLAACSKGAEAPAGEATTAATSAGLTVSNPRVVLAAVAGNPAAVYFDLSYSGAPGVALAKVEVAGGGMTMIHDYAEQAGKKEMVMADTVALTEGTPVSFAPGGLHVMVMEPSDALKAGGMAKVTLTLSDGTATTVEAPVRAAGEER
ncbi:MAG: copper chaperone PCu(A)C [Erythrobacter sp.]